MAARRLISVRGDVAAQLLIDGLLQAALARIDVPLPAATAATLDQAAELVLDARPDDHAAVGGAAARLGYHSRAVEWERFAVARARVPEIRSLLADASPAEVSAALARSEPAHRPAPDEASTGWLVPGPGGHVRHHLAVRAVPALRARGVGLPQADVKRCWTFGFLLRCCEEAPDEPVAPPGR